MTEMHPTHKADILVVDDTLPNLRLLVNLLVEKGYKVRPASNGLLALSSARAEPPDLILLDIKMPNMDGYEVCEQLKADAQTCDIPVIFISAINDLIDKVKAFSIGGVDYITKPFQVEEVLARVETHISLRNLQKSLHEKNEVLQETVHQLKATQKRLIESEKLAALGNLVAGVAHEINTPIGISVTAASTLSEDTQELVKIYKQGQMKRGHLETFLETAIESSSMILSNLSRAADLISSFKQVAVDQSSELKRRFKLKEYLQEVLNSLVGQLKKTNHTVSLDGDEDFILESYPGAFSQIITNLILNSITHAYEPQQAGQIKIKFRVQGKYVHLYYIDNGKGIPPENLDKIFDPFFTTNRSFGNTGLGLHIIYNLVTQQLKGSIDCESRAGHGTKFVIKFPIDEEVTHSLSPV
jgi:signal transduction histidine kinase